MAKDRRKIAWIGVVSGVAALAVAATGVTFAILSGNGSTSDPGNVEVDVLKGPYGTIEAELKDDSIALLGTGTKGQFISVEGKEDLQVSFAKLQANLSKAFVDENIDRTIDLKVDLITELPSLSADSAIGNSIRPSIRSSFPTSSGLRLMVTLSSISKIRCAPSPGVVSSRGRIRRPTMRRRWEVISQL